jgi:putative methionine-R-sulfoxide reductase with GAF domain
MSRLSDPWAASSRPEPAMLLKAGRRIKEQSWHNWLLLLGTLLVTTIGLSAATASLLANRDISPWAWSGSEWVLLGGLSIMVALFGCYLAFQRGKLSRLEDELDRTRESAIATTSRHYARLMALCRVSQTMSNETEIEAVFASMTQLCFSYFDCDRVSVMLVDRTTGELVVRAAMGHQGAAEIIGSRQRPGHGIAGWVARHREPVVLGEVVEEGRFEGFEPGKSGLTAAIVVPIQVRDELVGVISLSSRKPGIVYSDEDLRALEIFAGSAGLCLRHTEQAGWMRQTIWRLEGSLRERELSERVGGLDCGAATAAGTVEACDTDDRHRRAS